MGAVANEIEVYATQIEAKWTRMRDWDEKAKRLFDPLDGNVSVPQNQVMNESVDQHRNEPGEGDWCLVDLSDPITEEATKVAHALGMDFHDFMCLALEEKLAGMRGNEDLRQAVEKVGWIPLLKDIPEITVESMSKSLLSRRARVTE